MFYDGLFEYIYNQFCKTLEAVPHVANYKQIQKRFIVFDASFKYPDK